MTENTSSSEITPLSGEQLNDLVTSFDASQSNRLAMNAVTAAGIDKVALNYDRSRLLQRRFSVTVDNGEVTHQDRSGRCWLFSSLNVARFVAKKNLGVKEFEFSRTTRCTSTSWSVSTTSCRTSPRWFVPESRPTRA